MYDLNVLVFDIKKSQGDDAQVEKLNNLLALFGGKAEIKDSYDRERLVISYDDEKLEKWKTRNAGRTANYYNLSIDDVKEMISKLGAEGAAASLGITKQAMYKRIRKSKESGSDRF